MNNFFIDIVSLSYLDSAKKLSNDQNNVNIERVKALEKEVELKMEEFKLKSTTVIEVFVEKYYEKAKLLIDMKQGKDITKSQTK